MLTEVVHHQQHLFPQSSYSNHHNALKNLSPTLFDPPSSIGHVSPLQNASFRQRTERPQQYARPLRSTVALPQQSPLQTAYITTSEASEHMLRRKTPSGTLAAGYDGSPVEWTKRPHATKRFLTPSSNASVHTAYVPKPTPNLGDQIPRHQDRSLEPRVGEQLLIQPHQIDTSRERHQHASLVDGVKINRGRISSAIPSIGSGSEVNQWPVCQHLDHPAEREHVPTVLQPLWPPCMGSTSVEDSGPYEPCWLHGAFEPYQPAPLQVPRSRDQVAENHVDNSDQLHPAVSHYGQWLQAHSESQYPYTADRSPTSALSFAHEIDETLSPITEIKTSHGGSSAFSIRAAAKPQLHPFEPLAYRNKLSSWNDQGAKVSNDTRNYGSSASGSSSYLVLCHDPVSLQSNAQFKEKILVWANRIYANLLTSIEQVRRNSADEQRSGGSQFQSSFYPQLPRRPYPSWSNGHSRDSRSHPSTKAGTQTSLKVGPQDLNHCLRTPKYCTSSPTSDPALLHQSSSAQPSILANAHSRRWWQSRDEARRINSNAGQPSYVPPQMTSDLHIDSPSAAAMYALEMLGRLCQESGFEWTDGTLLTGCLAYGLGDYNKAMNWYLIVLQRDPNNVHAMSDLAATLFALDRRDEAEHYWFRSVKLRPDYFEAVEHLIGLLHEGHRGREAVRVIEYVEHALRTNLGPQSGQSNLERISHGALLHGMVEADSTHCLSVCGFGSGRYAIPPSDNGRMLALVHGKGNMLYQIGDISGAAQAFEDAILIGVGRRQIGIRGLTKTILNVFLDNKQVVKPSLRGDDATEEPILLAPDMALKTSCLVFPPQGRLPGLESVPDGLGRKAAISIVSNSLLSLAKIYQDAMSSSGASVASPRATSGIQEILALYYLSLSLQPSPSTANNVGILLASFQESARSMMNVKMGNVQPSTIPGVTSGTGIALALAYYDYGLRLDTRHAHLYTNLGSLFKDIGQLQAAIRMYEKAVECDGNFDIALANLANAVKDQGRVSEAIVYYKRAVASNPDFAEAICGLANALNSVCNWNGRGGIHRLGSNRDRWHVDERGDLYDSKKSVTRSPGWIERVVAIVERQLHDGESWGKGVLHNVGIDQMLQQLGLGVLCHVNNEKAQTTLRKDLESWAGNRWEGAKVVRLVERATKNLVRQIYLHQYVARTPLPVKCRLRPQLPAALAIPSAPTVLPFHTFTCPLSARQIRKISQRNGLRVSCSTLRAPWLPGQLYDPPPPPNPHLNVGYISSDFNNHPLAHLMQSVFGLHNQSRVKAFCYATTASDGSLHRQQIEREAPVFHDASSWSIDRLVNQAVDDGIHILVNLNGYTRGARNEVFAARPAPIQMSFMGFAGTLGAEWCDYLLADRIAIPPQTLRPWRGNVDLEDQTKDGNNDDDQDEWVYGENIIFTRDTFFCCDHRQSAPDSQETRIDWPEEQRRRWQMRKELFPDLADDTVILGNFNQLYKVRRSDRRGSSCQLLTLIEFRLCQQRSERGFAFYLAFQRLCYGSFDSRTLVKRT